MKKGMCFGLVMTLLVILKPSYTNSDNLALLASTLKTMQRAACDDEMVALACPKGTSISIQVAQYGKAAPQGHGCMADNLSEGPSDTKCMWPNSMQYSLLQTVVEACQKKPQCKFSTKPKPGLVDPCPLSRKFVEVAFKCRPYEFRSRTGCENEVIRLSCNPFSRIAIFDAQFGRRAYESIACPRQGAEESESIACLAPYAAETVMQICHGKRRCQVVASSKTFGNNCKSASYLKVIYACVPLGVLTERYESAAEKDEISNSKPNLNQDLFDEAEEDSGERWSETNVPPIADPALEQPQEVQTVTEGPASTVARPHSTKEADPSTSEDTSKSANTIMYITIGLVILVCLVTLLFIGFYLYMHRSSEDSKTGDMFTTEAPNVFNDAVSDIDNDIDVSHISGTFCGDVNPDMILYRNVPGSKGTIRAMKPLSTVYPSGVSMYGSDFVPSSSRTIDTSRYSRCNENVEIDSEVMVSPKSLRGYSNTEFYYG